MAPHGVGDTRLVPDAVARRLQDEGLLSASETFPSAPTSSAPKRPERAVLKPHRPAGVPDKRIAE
jgi:hypothetical protein